MNNDKSLDIDELRDIKCPICGNVFTEGGGALSRKDNKTEICSECGLQEAIYNYEKEKK